MAIQNSNLNITSTTLCLCVTLYIRYMGDKIILRKVLFPRWHIITNISQFHSFYYYNLQYILKQTLFVFKCSYKNSFISEKCMHSKRWVILCIYSQMMLEEKGKLYSCVKSINLAFPFRMMMMRLLCWLYTWMMICIFGRTMFYYILHRTELCMILKCIVSTLF